LTAGPQRLSQVAYAAEVLLVQERRGGAAASHRTLELIQDLPITLVNVDLELAARAAYLKTGAGFRSRSCRS
jgi:uncharacterized protein with PIN domain